MGLGLVATISNALRNDFQTELTSSDMTYNMTGVTVVAILELSSGIIAACIPGGMPLYTWHKQRTKSKATSSYKSTNYLNMQNRRSKNVKASSLHSSDAGSMNQFVQPSNV
ncbi:uncharacterized protein N7484_003222 [Penicillium longicatenatum]|uniref:uncharacterized protein n=1 Tax=Penicillium longicatenatum TaxID=1561947 RepID=UPI0025481674|nr:uncharacterized protein N7484_003222 [Penicillium longicatenatum]KAJ5649499.1 hypothetical protein N7484_003222 [Penicillium longicatenatum]